MKQKLLPYGISEVPRESTFKTFCPKCREVYGSQFEKHDELDGAFFGPNFAHYFMLSNPELFEENSENTMKILKFPVRLYGFKLHETAISRPKEIAEISAKNGEVKMISKVPPKFAKTIEAELSKTRIFITNINKS